MAAREVIKTTTTPQTAVNTPIDWLQVRAVVGEAFDRSRLFYHPDGDRRQESTARLMRIASGLREYALTGPEDLAQVWVELRGDVLTLDMLLDVTSEMLLLTGHDVISLSRSYATAVHAAIPRNLKNGASPLYVESAFDDGFMESVGLETELVSLLAANPWVLTLLVLKHDGSLSLLRATHVKTQTVNEGTDA